MSTSPSPAPAPDAVAPLERRLVLLVGAIVLVDTIFFAAITPLLPEYTRDLALSKASAGVLTAVYGVGVLAGSLPAGWLAGRLGVRPTVLIGLAVMGSSSLAFGFAHQVVLLDVARFGQGAGGSALWGGGLAWLIAATPRERRAELMGGAMGAATFGSLLGPTLGALASVAGTEATFGGVALAAVGLAWVTVGTAAPPPGHRRDSGGFARAARSRPALTGVWLIAVPSLGFGVVAVLAPLRLADLGAGAVAIGAVFLAASAFETVVSPLVGRLADRRGTARVARFGLALAAGLTILLPLAGVGWLFAVVVVLVCPTYGILWVPGMALISEGAEAVGLHQGFAFAIFNMAWAAAQIAGSGGGAALAQATGDTAVYALLAALCAGTLAVLGRRRTAPA